MEQLRYQQRFENFKRAFAQLERFMQHPNLNEMEAQGLIKAFEYTYELSWKVLQDYLKEVKGYVDISGPNPVIKQSFQDNIISNGTDWMKMHKSRNLTSQAFDNEIANDIIQDIRTIHYNLFLDFKNKMNR
ncbi:nucleotidyltransferase [Flammeovirga sp. MY04]|uniref:HI0074 family nucleotidyltransferase substrate-binding subunit n=1 Tax=Flammeovirga sp. MY04 TaxID=1191459 RepID=UPI0008060DC9|nr:HI0074 family nucleotidyltransferase substrate-binding subunit [Flammeovirga sp. MY04]ANQ47882.1 nucleotidyltransferase [Flammeovirga sp. MY04]